MFLPIGFSLWLIFEIVKRVDSLEKRPHVFDGLETFYLLTFS